MKNINLKQRINDRKKTLKILIAHWLFSIYLLIFILILTYAISNNFSLEWSEYVLISFVVLFGIVLFWWVLSVWIGEKEEQTIGFQANKVIKGKDAKTLWKKIRENENKEYDREEVEKIVKSSEQLRKIFKNKNRNIQL